MRHAGAPRRLEPIIKEVVETCRSCRMWARPRPRSVTASSRLARSFNEIVQWDILFHRSIMISVLIDEAVRWTTASVLPSKSSTDIVQAITLDWVRPYGPMRLLVADQEGGLLADESAVWLDRWQIQLRTKEPGTHAQLVERHHDMFRRLLLRVESQIDEDGLAIPLPIIVAECCLAKNLLTSVVGTSPYQAVFGRQPPIFADLSRTATCSWSTTRTVCQVAAWAITDFEKLRFSKWST